jgi:ABC-type dipeptide/oligopeptide/nickel transport system ATPase component
MQRVAIIGNAGGGKSVLARKLGDLLGLPVYQFDDLQWRPSWTRTPEEEVRATHSAWLAQPKWVIDGWGSHEILARRFKAADTIILVDFPIAIHYWWAAKRQLKAALHLNHGWPPEGCDALPVTGRLFKLMWKIHQEMLPPLVELIHQYSQDTLTIHLKSPHEMRRFLKSIDE